MNFENFPLKKYELWLFLILTPISSIKFSTASKNDRLHKILFDDTNLASLRLLTIILVSQLVLGHHK
jgi:hypothetical protein